MKRISVALTLLAALSGPAGCAPKKRDANPMHLPPICKHGCQNAPFYNGSSRIIPFHCNDRSNCWPSWRATFDEAEKEGGTIAIVDGGDYSFRELDFSIVRIQLLFVCIISRTDEHFTFGVIKR